MNSSREYIMEELLIKDISKTKIGFNIGKSPNNDI